MSYPVEDDAAARETLLQWATSNRLGEAVLSDDGMTLSLQGSVLSGAALVTVEHGGKSCTYRAASIFLQIVDPHQGLIAYRNACKKYGCDPVKALDKPTVVGYFVGTTTAAEGPPAAGAAASAASAPAAVAEADAATTAVDAESRADAHLKAAVDRGEEAAAALAAAPDHEAATGTAHEGGEAAPEGDDRREKSSRRREDKKDRDRHKDKHGRSRKEKERSDRKHKSHRSGRDEAGASSAASPQRKKKKAKIVTNEQLFSNLSLVVDKRQLERKAQEEITMALSADGFQVTPEMLEEHRETTQMILANEIPVGNSASILRATNPKKTLTRVLELYLETVNPGKSSGKGKPGHRSGSGAAVPSKPVRTHLIGKKPVIVVPKGMTSPITLLNAHEFLCNGKFVPRDVMLKQVGGPRGALSSSTTFTRKVRSASGSHSGLLEFEIMDNPRKLGNNPKEWERIVAVIVLGQSWQFKDWPPPYNSPVQLFSQTLGYYISMEGDKIPAEISGWAVKQAKLKRDKRGLDSVTYAGFWNALEEFMAVHRAELLPQQEV